jgi:biotin transport system substrate-specific component
MAQSLTLARHEAAAPNALWRKLGIAVAATGLVALCAHITVPLFFTPVPLTLQTFAVLFLALALGPRWGFATLSLYLVEGAAGLPVFSPHGPGGLMQLVGPTGGYLLSYPFAAAVTGFLYRGHGFARAAWAGAVGSLVIFFAGSMWLAFFLHLSAKIAITQGVLPFVPGDMLKVCAAAAAVTAVQSLRQTRREGSASDEL